MSPRPRIYTRTGDAGSSALSGGERLPKTASVFVAMGDIDELSANLGLLKATLAPAANAPHAKFKIQYELLDAVQHELISVSAALCGARPYTNEACAAFVKRLESAIDALEDAAPAASVFVTPGANLPSARAHVARTVCRRAERSLVAHAPASPALPLLNRLSDYLFALAEVLAR